MGLLRKISVSILLCATSACGFVSYEDVSNIEPYSNYIGKTNISTQVTFIDLISMHPDYKPDPSEYMIRDQEFALGPEVLSRSELPKGTIFTVTKVLRCTDCYLDFGERLKLHVQLSTEHPYKDTIVTTSGKLLRNVYVEKTTANK